MDSTSTDVPASTPDDGGDFVTHDCGGTIHRFKAHGGDRAANLDGIADALDGIVAAGDNGLAKARRLSGYAEQLRIIAAELRAAARTEGGDAHE